MNKGLNLVQLAQEIQRQAEAKKDYVAPTSKIEMDVLQEEGSESVVDASSVRLNIDGVGALPVTSVAHEQIGERLQIPKRYYDRMLAESPFLLATNVNEWMGRAEESRMVRTLDGNVRAFLSAGYRILDNHDLAEVILGAAAEMKGDLVLASSAITERRMYMKFVLPTLRAEVRPGDIIEAGVAVRNSEVGDGRLSIDPFLHRLICTNGAIINDMRFRKTHVGKKHETLDAAYELFADETRAADDRAFFLKARDVFKSALTATVFERQIRLMKEATEHKIEGSVEQSVKVLAQRFTLTDSERGSVLQHLIEGGDLTKYGMFNAVTRSAQDIESYDRATEFEQLGGQVLLLPAPEWKTIATAKAA